MADWQWEEVAACCSAEAVSFGMLLVVLTAAAAATLTAADPSGDGGDSGERLLLRLVHCGNESVLLAVGVTTVKVVILVMCSVRLVYSISHKLIGAFPSKIIADFR